MTAAMDPGTSTHERSHPSAPDGRSAPDCRSAPDHPSPPGRRPLGRRVKELARRRPLATFAALAYLLSWSYWVPLAVSGAVVRSGHGWPSHFPGLLGPLLAAVTVTVLTSGRDGVADLGRRLGRWRVPLRWYAVMAAPLALFAVAAVGLDAAGTASPPLAALGRFTGLPALGIPLVWLLMLVVNGVGEETGWRGFAVPQAQRVRSPLAASLLIAVIWAGWHLPLFFLLESYRGFSLALMPGFFLGLASGAVVLSWIYNRSGASVLMAAGWHTTYNIAAATDAAHGTVAAVVTAVVMVWAAVLIGLEVRASRRGFASVLGSPWPATTRW